MAHEDDETFNKLIRNIRQHKTVFTLSLGLSELLADFKYVDVLDFREIRDVEKKIVSVVPLNIVHKYGTTFEEEKILQRKDSSRNDAGTYSRTIRRYFI